MAKYKHIETDQLRMYPLNFDELFGEEHPIHNFKNVMSSLDFSEFNGNYKNEIVGRPALEPKRVMSAIFYSILLGNISMRELCRLSKVRAELIFLLGGEELDHSFLSRFRKLHIKEIQNLFIQTVFLGTESGMIDFETISIDGTKIKANANRSDIGKLEDFEDRYKKLKALSKRKLKEWSKETDSEKIDKRKKKLEKKKAALEEAISFLKENTDRNRVHLYEKDCGFQKKDGNFLVGYNAQGSVDYKSGMFLAQTVERGPTDVIYSIPMISLTEENCKKVLNESLNLPSTLDRLSQPVYLQDAGYASEANYRELKDIDLYCPDVSIAKALTKGTLVENPPEKLLSGSKIKNIEFNYKTNSDTFLCSGKRRLRFTRIVQTKTQEYKEYRTGGCGTCRYRGLCTGSKSKSILVRNEFLVSGYSKTCKVKETPMEKIKSYYTWKMREKLSTESSKKIYSKRFSSIEGAFGVIKGVRKGYRFLLKGIHKVRLEWSERCIAYNIGKLSHFSMNAF
ncbi:transposase, IS4 family [Leptospira weilii serovar Ranarum str. ICFT]|uniref:Transposase, IS4 family n=1 Tax=Leptospira weilii serovar Ranarum str. ICFT TaxID=1218598 RepID=N1W869_9LEPT|nr:transposase [Leptospira weilii]EMY76421.1 transposase, IS4 family [Leptospira weilii serovar Ranarum str. ICFT]